MLWHPMSVHFPIALSCTALGLYLYGLLKEEQMVWKGAYVLHGLATVGAILAIFTGRDARSDLLMNPELESLLQTHELVAYLFVWLLAMLFVWQYLRVKRMPSSEKWIFILAYLFILGTMTYGSWIGGKMVYEEGAGVKQTEQVSSP